MSDVPEPDTPAALPSLRDTVARHGLDARKSLGQHFLLDPAVCERVARQAGDLAGRHVVEVGPGPGGLTRALLDSPAAHVTAIELDRRAIAALAELSAAFPGRLTVLEADALAVDAAKTELQRLPGIGPFYSTLITVRACGLTDVLATEPQVLKHLEATYGRAVDAAELEQLAEGWRPWRTWVTVMLRAIGGRADAGG